MNDTTKESFLSAVKGHHLLAAEDLSDGEEEAALETLQESSRDGTDWDTTVSYAASFIKGMRRVKKRNVPDSARAGQEIVPKRTAVSSPSIDKKRTKFHLTIPGESDKAEYLSLPLSFEEEPTPIALEMAAKDALGGSCPSLYYPINDGIYFSKLCSEDEKLPADMIQGNGGYVELRPADGTPNPRPEKPHGQAYCVSEANVFFESLKKRLSGGPHLKNPLEEFAEIPVLFLDGTIEELSEVLQRSNPRDTKTHALFAVTGSGKSRTVEESCKKAFGSDTTVKYVREKLSNRELEKQFNIIENKHSSDFSTASYDTVRSWFLPTAEQYLQAIVDKNKGIKALHLDEVQCIMGHHIFNSSDYETVKKKATQDGKSLVMRDFYMPTLCFALSSFAAKTENPQVVMTGTNFFSPVYFNPGSVLKPIQYHLHGKFPESWVMENLVDHYFDLQSLPGHSVHGDKFRDVIRDISENRRVVQYFLGFLKRNLARCGDQQQIDANELMELVLDSGKKAVTLWAQCCANFELTQSCVAALGFCLYPEGLGGVRETRQSGFPVPYQKETIEVISIKSVNLPQAVKDYANAGGLNIWPDDHDLDKELVEMPAGCLRKFLLKKCKGSTSVKNGTDIAALGNVTEKVDPNMKGHLFERLFAFELTTFGSGVAAVVCEKLSVAGRQMRIDAQMFGADWVITPTIMDNWKEGSMHCIYEASNARGRRKVDVGFPLINVATSPKETWRVYCKLKCGYTPGKLWELCWTFLQEMEDRALASSPCVCAVFVASIEFENCATLVKGGGLAQARSKVLEHDLYKKGRFFVLDGAAFEEKSLSGLLGNDQEQALDFLCEASQVVSRKDVHVSDSQ